VSDENVFNAIRAERRRACALEPPDASRDVKSRKQGTALPLKQGGGY
jgi:hypothetical protein